MTRTFPYSLDAQDVIFHVSAVYDPGEFVERAHFANGHGSGWEITDIIVTSEDGRDVTDVFPYHSLLNIAHRETDWPKP